MRKYRLPRFLEGVVSQQSYDSWLSRKASAHVKRDRKRGNSKARIEEYKIAIHKAVAGSHGKDAYTHEELAWDLLSQYDNEESKKSGRGYKRRFALLPTVDHVSDGLGCPDFKVCSWRTNDAKNDLSLSEFIELCQKVLAVNKVD